MLIFAVGFVFCFAKRLGGRFCFVVGTQPTNTPRHPSVLPSDILQQLLADACESLSWTAESEFPTLLVCLREISARCIALGLAADGTVDMPAVVHTVVNAALQIHFTVSIAHALGSFLLQPALISKYVGTSCGGGGGLIEFTLCSS